jgi:hypothetical protein
MPGPPCLTTNDSSFLQKKSSFFFEEQGMLASPLTTSASLFLQKNADYSDLSRRHSTESLALLNKQ